jgi:hypothetical protein
VGRENAGRSSRDANPPHTDADALGRSGDGRRPLPALDPLMRRAGGLWESGSRRLKRRRIGPVIRSLQRVTDPLFRRVGLVLE